MSLTDTKKAFLEHLSELRKVLIYCVISLLACFIIIFVLFCDELMDFVLAPIRQFGIDVVYTTLGEVWLTEMKVCFIAGFIAAFPAISFFFWRFLRPALYQNERKAFALIYFLSLLLFILGVCFAYFVVLALTINFFVTTGEGTAVPMLTISKYVEFLTSFIIPFGLVFLLPMVVLALTKVGVLQVSTLVKSRKYVIVILAILAAILTPPDVVSQLLLLIPMVILWEISILIAKRVERKKERSLVKTD
ncbi:MAG TPA: twin-arginine translocase subunit TatC [Firmicutes bacterium]|nr:twin-arginine translocase subunit TatC [Bacillota bacterium]